MTSVPGADRGIHAVAVVDGDNVWVDATGALPRVEADHPGLDELVPGRSDLQSLAPRRALTGVSLHVLAPRLYAPMPDGWSVRPLRCVQETSDVLEVVALEVARFRGEAPRPPRRAPWYDARWLPARTAWVDEVLAREGAARTDAGQVLTTWPLSTVVRFSARDADGARADVVLKGCCDYFSVEPALTACVAGLAPTLLVETLAVDAAARTLLLRAFPQGASEPHDGDLVTVAAAVARLQVASLDRGQELAASGCPDRRLAATRDRLLRELGPTLGADAVDDLARLESLGPPAALVHGDLHRDNIVRLPGGAVRVFDWSDTCWAHPALDVAHLTRGLGAETAADVWRAWCQVWAASGSEIDEQAVRSVATRVDVAHQLLTYRTLLRSLEDGTTAGMGGITARLRSHLAGATDSDH